MTISNEKLVRLLMGTEEDVIIALSYIVDGDYFKFLDEKHTIEEREILHSQRSHDRPFWVFNSKFVPGVDNLVFKFNDCPESFYYMVGEGQKCILYNRYILVFCEYPYNPNLPTINHIKTN